MELFSELYGCYYTVIADILRRAHGEGITKEEIAALVEERAFSESGLHLIPRLLSGEWDLLRREGDRYRSKLGFPNTALPLTTLQKSWLRAILSDRRMGLFLDREEIAALDRELEGVPPLFLQRDFHVFDAAGDGDDYHNPDYVRRFRLVLEAVKEQRPLLVEYVGGKQDELTLHFLPTRILYSAKDDKFRSAGLHLLENRARRILLNISRIQSIQPSEHPLPRAGQLEARLEERDKRTVTLAITGERNALERCMLQFASYDKQTIFDEETGRHLCEISYDPQEETELLIRVLSFGPVVEVVGPPAFVALMRERVRLQMDRMSFV